MNAPGTVHVVVPEGADDPARPSGGNVYDARVCRALAAAGWRVEVREELPGLPALPDGAVVLVDGLVASPAPSVLLPVAGRLRLVVLAHLPLGVPDESPAVRARERAVLTAAAAVVTTSAWTRDWLVRAYGVDPARLHVARPGTDRAPLAARHGSGHRLLCVGAVAPGKGQDLLLEALAARAHEPWRCTCVGPLDRDPGLVADLRRRAGARGVEQRFRLVGVRTGARLEASYAAADLLVLPSRFETFGMVVTEALARGLPVLAADVGGVREALGVTPRGRLPGLLVPPGDADALAAALTSWWGSASVREQLRDAAGERRAHLPGWEETAAVVGRVLEGVAA